MSDRALWNAEKEACPGIGTGELHGEREIRECLEAARRRDNYRRLKKNC